MEFRVGETGLKMKSEMSFCTYYKKISVRDVGRVTHKGNNQKRGPEASTLDLE